jgi:prevent-host-death family protein
MARWRLKELSQKRKGSRRWQLQDAKNRLSEVVASAREEGPQTITLRGRPAAVVVSFEEFSRLTRPATTLTEFLLRSPLKGVDLKIDLSRDAAREVDL